MKKNILIVYGTMSIGGSTTSLLSLLHCFDFSKYDVDLALANTNGELSYLLPKNLNILPGLMPQNLEQLKRHSLRAIITYFIAKVLAINSKNSKNVIGQIMSYENVRLSRKTLKKYDIAISFLENYPLVYVANNVNACHKISWIHVDYKAAGFIRLLDKECFSKFDNIVLVSNECKKSFDEEFPKLSNRSVVIENILLKDTIIKLSEQKVNFKVSKKYLNIVTVCRISFSHKGLDRVIKAFKKLKDNQIDNCFKWYVIGNGIDFEIMKKMIAEYNLKDTIILLGEKKNPLPYVKLMDLFLLPSRYEGKPMAVTEAQMLDVPPLVTNYSSAAEQVNSGYDGMIVNNSDDAIFDAFCFLIKNIGVVDEWKKNLSKRRFDNASEINKIYSLIEGKND